MNFFSPIRAFDRSTLRPLRGRQPAAIEAIRQAVREGHKRIIVQAPCGFGKTITAAHLIAGALEKGKRALFTAPAIQLVEQTLASFESEGIHDIGVLQGCHERTDWNAAVQIASVQTLVRRRDPDFDLVIIDEAHSSFNGLNQRLTSPAWANKIVIGLSATPWARGMGLTWSKLIIAATTRELIDEGWLCPFEVYSPGIDPNLSDVRTTAGEYNEKDLSEAMDKPQLVADAVETYQRLGEGRQGFVFAVDRAHAASLQDEFMKAGIRAGYIDGFSPPEDRAETFERYRSGEYRLICNVGVLLTGVDEDVRILIDCAPTRSIIRHVQKIGRGLRLAEGKDTCLILDHAGNSERLGLVTDIHRDRLDMRKPGERVTPDDPSEKPVPKPLKCNVCSLMIPPGMRECPSCKTVVRKGSTVLVADGQLVKFGCDAPAPIGKPKTAKDRVAALGKQAVFGMLEARRIERGYAPGWSANQYRELFGVWPKSLSNVPVEPMAPELASWLRAKQIAFSKGRERRPAHG